MKSSTGKQGTRRSHSGRTVLLKYLHSRQVLILVCTLVFIECLCVMAELMVDLQEIRIRFENEETEVEKFVQFMRSKNPEAYNSFDGKSLEEILLILRETMTLWEPSDSHGNCSCTCPPHSTGKVKRDISWRRKRKSGVIVDPTGGRNERAFEKKAISEETGNHVVHMPVGGDKHGKGFDLNQETPFQNNDERLSFQLESSSQTEEPEKTTVRYNTNTAPDQKERPSDEVQPGSVKGPRGQAFSWKPGKLSKYLHTQDVDGLRQNPSVSRLRRDVNYGDTANVPHVFVFTVNNEMDNFHLVSQYKTVTSEGLNRTAVIDQIIYKDYYSHYEKIHTISHAIHYAGIAILSIMVIETVMKCICMGVGFFKKKLEVFDAIIVVVSFALDVIFLDSRWYETGKDATTILVLLLPWRVVRIVNSFLMTINHKHHIEIMTVRRAKKRAELKLGKIRNLVVEIRRDVDLLIQLARVKGAGEGEIAACIYGKGRGTATLAAITSFASLMFISTLGKVDPSASYYDDVYGDLIRDVFSDDDEDTDKTTVEEESADKVDSDLDSVEPITDFEKSKSHSFRYNKKVTREKRRNTLPRRQGSQREESEMCYVNDGYVTTNDDAKARDSRRRSMFSKSSVRSLPMIPGPSKNYVTFEVTTQVTYL